MARQDVCSATSNDSRTRHDCLSNITRRCPTSTRYYHARILLPCIRAKGHHLVVSFQTKCWRRLDCSRSMVSWTRRTANGVSYRQYRQAVYCIYITRVQKVDHSNLCSTGPGSVGGSLWYVSHVEVAVSTHGFANTTSHWFLPSTSSGWSRCTHLCRKTITYQQLGIHHGKLLGTVCFLSIAPSANHSFSFAITTRSTQ